MHLHFAVAEAAAEVVELHVLVIGEQGHRHGAIREAFRDHESREALAERIVMHAGVPDADLLRHPRFLRADGDGHLWDHRDIAAS